MTITDVAFSDGLVMTSTNEPVQTYSVPFADIVRLVSETFQNQGFVTSVTDTVTSTVTASPLDGLQLFENLYLTPAQTANSKSNVSVADGTLATAAVTAALTAALTDLVTMTASQSLQSAVTIIDRLGLADVLATTFKYNKTWADQVAFTDGLGRFFGADIADQVTFDAALAALFKAYNTISEAVSVTETPTPQMLISASSTEAINLTAAELIQGIYSGTLAETIELTGGYMDPGGGFATWAINTRSGAVTEYQNYAFNSFARIGNKYVGASETGLYELAGDTDNGTSIVATLKGAYMQFGGPHLSRLKEAYIAHSGVEGKFVLKIETQDGHTYTYQIDARSGRNSKVHMGKGQRSRYFAYTLTSTGQDFNLDTLEFVPIVVQRRV